MGEVPTAANVNYGAAPASLAQPRHAELPAADADVLGHVLEGVIEHVEPEPARAIEGRLERVDRLDLAVGFDHDQIDSADADRLDLTLTPADHAEHRVKDSNRRAVRPARPAVEAATQPVAIGRLLKTFGGFARRAPVVVV